MSAHPYATAKVRYEEFDGNVELSTTFKADSSIEFMEWVVKATEFYQARLRFEAEYHYVRAFIIEYRMNNESGSITVTRNSVKG